MLLRRERRGMVWFCISEEALGPLHLVPSIKSPAGGWNLLGMIQNLHLRDPVYRTACTWRQRTLLIDWLLD